MEENNELLKSMQKQYNLITEDEVTATDEIDYFTYLYLISNSIEEKTKIKDIIENELKNIGEN